MSQNSNVEENNKKGPWVISESRLVQLNLSKICDEPVKGSISECKISGMARYLLNPNPITLEEEVIGCKVYYNQTTSGVIRYLSRKMTFSGKDTPQEDSEEIISSLKTGYELFKDRNLNKQFEKIIGLLNPFDPVKKKLTSIDKNNIRDIKAICQDIGKNHHEIDLKGTVDDKVKYILTFLSKTIKINVNNIYLTNGLFDVRGLHLDSLDISHRLISFSTQKNQKKYYVLNADYQTEFEVKDSSLLNYLYLLEHSVKADPNLVEAITLCSGGNGKPLKLFFSDRAEQNYSVSKLPKIYRQMLLDHKIGIKEKEILTNLLNKSRNIVAFNYVPTSGTGNRKLYTNISVLHDLKALEPIKEKLPELYLEINKKSSVSVGGTFYLLDSMRGSQNV